MKDLIAIFTYCPDTERKLILIELLQKHDLEDEIRIFVDDEVFVDGGYDRYYATNINVDGFDIYWMYYTRCLRCSACSGLESFVRDSGIGCVMLKQTSTQGFYQDSYGNFSATKTELGYVLVERFGVSNLTVGTFKTLKECNQIVRYGVSA